MTNFAANQLNASYQTRAAMKVGDGKCQATDADFDYDPNAFFCEYADEDETNAEYELSAESSTVQSTW